MKREFTRLETIKPENKWNKGRIEDKRNS